MGMNTIMRLYEKLCTMREEGVMQKLSREAFESHCRSPSDQSLFREPLVYNKMVRSEANPNLEGQCRTQLEEIEPITDEAEAVDLWLLEYDSKFLKFYESIRDRYEAMAYECPLGTYTQFMSFVYSVTVIVI